jgi:hypothetical protein
MAEFEKVEFEFPDEKTEAEDKANAEVETKDDIEIVDDTPVADRGRTPMAEPPKEFAEDELAKYDASVQQRIKHFTKGYHEERRAKEAALREREEALRIAQTIVEENKKLKGSLGQNQAAVLDSYKKLAANELEKAKSKYKEAYESGDSEAITEAQAGLTTAAMRAERVNNIKAPPLQEEKTEVQRREEARIEPVSAPAPDYKAQDWQQKNQWFGKDEEMTSFALGLHTKLVNSGVDPKSDEYYERLNGRLRQVFPESCVSEKNLAAPTPSPAKKKLCTCNT